MRPQHALPLVTLSLLSTAAAMQQLRPRGDAIVNATTTATTLNPLPTLTTATTNPEKTEHLEQSATGYEPEPSATAKPQTFTITASPIAEIIQPSATGWETHDHWGRPPPASQPNPDPGDDHTNPPVIPPPEDHREIPAVPQVTPGGPDELLDDIVSHITDAPQPGAQPNAQPTPPTVVIDNSASVTLTPGLSTTVGSTVVVIQTGTAESETVVVVSPSGGRATTTTITRPPPSRTSTTSAGKPGVLTSAGETPISTSSPGAGVARWNRNGKMECLLGIVAGIGILF